MHHAASTAFPNQKRRRFSQRAEQLLLLCYYDPAGIPTVPETVAYIQDHSEFSITVLNLFEHGRNGGVISLSPLFNIEKFDGIIIHNTISYNVDNLKTLDQLLETPLRKFKGVKVLMKQDENYRFKELAEYIGETQYDLIFTCLPETAIPHVYPEHLVGTPRFSRMLTGYITPTLRSLRIGNSQRPIDIGYRGSIQPLSFGRLAYEKRKIGDDVARLLKGSGLNLNISSRWEDRLGADAWLQFLASAKGTLGAESGASVFDLAGDLQSRCDAAESQLGPFSPDAEYAEAYLSKLKDLEGIVYYNQVSPRHFEAAATRTLQIMYPGRYSDIFLPGRHFVELSRDYSNLSAVVDVLLDDKERKYITDRAYEEIVLSPKYWIETFVSNLDNLISEALPSSNLRRHSVQTGHTEELNALLLVAHKPASDPRLSWIADCAPKNLKVTQIGVLPPASNDPVSSFTANGNLILAKPRIQFTSDMLAAWYSSTVKYKEGWAGLSEISFITFALSLPESRFLELIAAPAGSNRAADFKWYLNYILDTTATLISIVERIRGFDAIIAADLDTLPAALILKGFTGVPVIYDAHEYWPEADIASFEFETQFWAEMEKRLVHYTDHRQTVSPGLAELMSSQYKCSFDTVPNCEPLSALPSTTKPARQSDQICRFIYQGNLAPSRGLDLLIEAWPNTTEQAHLLLRGPDSEYKAALMEKARLTGLLGLRIFFPPPVAEHAMISAAQDGDVGLIPYTPDGKNYMHCCPNKTSQYMAATLPILANNTKYVKSIIETAGAGLVTDFSKPNNIVAAVADFVSDPEKRLTMGRNGYRYFIESFHWENASKSMYEKIIALIGKKSTGRLEILPAVEDRFLYIDKSPATAVTMCSPIESEAHAASVLRSSFSTVARGTSSRALKFMWRLLPQSIRFRLGPAIRRVIRTVSGM